MRKVLAAIICTVLLAPDLAAETTRSCAQLIGMTATKAFGCVAHLSEKLVESENNSSKLQEKIEYLENLITSSSEELQSARLELKKAVQITEIVQESSANQVAAILIDKYRSELVGPKGDQGSIGPQGREGRQGPRGNIGPRGKAPSAVTVATSLLESTEFKDFVRALAELQREEHTKNEALTPAGVGDNATQQPANMQSKRPESSHRIFNTKDCIELRRDRNLEGIIFVSGARLCLDGNYFGDLIISYYTKPKFVRFKDSGTGVKIEEGGRWKINTLPFSPTFHVRAIEEREDYAVGGLTYNN